MIALNKLIWKKEFTHGIKRKSYKKVKLNAIFPTTKIKLMES